MQSKTLAANQSAVGFSVTGDGSVNNPPPAKIADSGWPQGNLQVSIVGASASVSVFGRASPSLPWALVTAAITANGVTSVPVLAEMYSQVTAISAAVVNVALSYPKN